MKNIKYYAGLFDADGCFDVHPTKRENGTYYLNLRAILYQKDIRPLIPLASFYGANIVNYDGCSRVVLNGSKAQMFMEMVKKHLIIKRRVVEHILPLKGTTVEDMKAVRASVKEARTSFPPEKDFPSRQWMAGYIDGDGCIYSNYRKKDGVLEFKLTVVSHYTQEVGLLLMQKAFGGFITHNKDVRYYHNSLSVSKGKQLLEYFGKHLVVKKQQADLVLDCLRSKRHLKREGATSESNWLIHKQLQALKSPTTTKSSEQENIL